ncbi:unnamed protein product [Durusdinium trenchii]|uniref:Uncharacterized protein n=1 Tax=Durusdinium trenchii TaxID=1381693 RepID=A0ABP0J7X1_9DINO
MSDPAPSNQREDQRADTFHDLLLALEADGKETVSGVQSCTVCFRQVGIEIQHNDEQQWFVPWEAMPEVLEASPSRLGIPESHPHVVQLQARFSFGFSSCTGCKFNIAARSRESLDAIAQTVLIRSSQATALEPPSDLDRTSRSGADGFGDSDAASSPHTSVPAPIMHGTGSLANMPTPRAPPRTHQERFDIASNFESGGQSLSAAERMPAEILAALLDEPKVPEPLTLQHAWLHLPPVCPIYHRCLVCVDKLGLSLRPLALGKSSKYKAAELHASGLKVLHTESLSFPLSSILDVEEASEISMLPQGLDGAQPSDLAIPDRTQHLSQNGVGGRRHYLPLARFVFSRRSSRSATATQQERQSHKQKPNPELAERLPAAAAYFVIIKVRAGVIGKVPGQERLPPCMRMRDSRPPIQLALALYSKQEVSKLIATVLSFKSYQASTASASILYKTRAIHDRSKIPHEEADAHLPGNAASQARILTNDDGEVFWYVPKRQDTGSLSKPELRPEPPEPCFGRDADAFTISI